MKLLLALFGKNKPRKTTRKSIKDYQQELLVKQGRTQIQKLLKLGQMPVAVA
jgi:hypothetical protein